MKYKTKPCEIEAIQWNSNTKEIIRFCGKNCTYELEDSAWEVGVAPPVEKLTIHTLEGDMIASRGDYIIRGLNGEFYPCKPDIFEKKYEALPKQTIVFDFDGVIHSYTSPWKGPAVIPDPPVHGIKEAIEDIRSLGYEVIVVSTRCSTKDGKSAINTFLKAYDIIVDGVQMEKPPAIAYIDDRAICFDGHPETLVEKIRNFKPWNK